MQIMDADDEVQRAQFQSRIARLVSKAPHGLIRDCFVVDLVVTEPLWKQTRIDLNPRDWVTTLTVGCTRPSHTLDTWVGARSQLWMRVGPQGTILRSTRDTHSFLAFESGPLYLASRLSDRSSLDANNRVKGHLSVGVLLWKGPTLRGLKQIARLGELDELIDSEIDRIRNAEPPEGWQYNALLDPADPVCSCGDDECQQGS